MHVAHAKIPLARFGSTPPPFLLASLHIHMQLLQLLSEKRKTKRVKEVKQRRGGRGGELLPIYPLINGLIAERILVFMHQRRILCTLQFPFHF